MMAIWIMPASFRCWWSGPRPYISKLDRAGSGGNRISRSAVTLAGVTVAAVQDDERVGPVPLDLGIWARRGVVVAGGVTTALAFQPYNLWPLLALGVAALTIGVYGARSRQAAGLGYLYGLSFLALAIGWVYVIAVPVAIVLVAFESLWFLGLGLLLRRIVRVRYWPPIAAGAWLLVEASYSRFPFGGFGWVRLAFTAADAPINGLFPFVGAAGVSFLVALLGQLVAWVVLAVLAEQGAFVRRAVAAGVVVAFLTAAGLAGRLYAPAADEAPPINVGMVQGNVDGVGVEFLGRQRSVTNNHLSETVTLMAQARAGRVPTPDFVLWPENSTDIDPTRDAETEAVVKTSARVAQVPILVGAVMEGPGPYERQTTSLWWDGDKGVTASYSKRNLVPFGEWIPFRRQLLPIIPMLQMVGAQGVPGTGPGVLSVDVPRHGSTRVGVMICFELAYDDTFREMMSGNADTGGGAQLVTVQSNNATYARTGQIAQQWAITRVRAMESRREVLVATTNALSGFISADGSVVYETKVGTAASTAVTMPVRSALTPAVRYGGLIEYALVAASLVGLVLALVGSRPGLRASRQTSV